MCSLLLTMEEVAKRMKVSEPTVRKVIRERGLKVIRFGRQVRVPEKELESWFEQEAVIKDWVYRPENHD